MENIEKDINNEENKGNNENIENKPEECEKDIEKKEKKDNEETKENNEKVENKPEGSEKNKDLEKKEEKEKKEKEDKKEKKDNEENENVEHEDKKKNEPDIKEKEQNIESTENIKNENEIKKKEGNIDSEENQNKINETDIKEKEDKIDSKELSNIQNEENKSKINNEGNLETQKDDSKQTNNTYEIVELKYKTKYGELFLVTDNKKEELLMNKIEIQSSAMKKKILEELEILKSIKSSFVFRIKDYYLEKKEENETINIIIENFIDINLHHLIYNTKLLNKRFIWRIFIELALGLKEIYLVTNTFKYLVPQNIFIDKENNIKIGGFNFMIDFQNKENNQNIDFSSYESPEVLRGAEPNQKGIVWSLGCILYELCFAKKPFDDIYNMKYKMPDNCENDLKTFLPKLLCEETKRLDLNQLIYDPIFKTKIFDVNLFYEAINFNIKSKS